MVMAEKEGGTDPREVVVRQNLLQKRQTFFGILPGFWTPGVEFITVTIPPH